LREEDGLKIDFTGRQTEIPAEVRRRAERKLAKLAKLLPSVTRAHVILTADKHRQIAEVSVHSRQLDLLAVEISTDAQLSVAKAIDKLLRQVEKQRTRRRVRKGAESPRLAGAAGRREARLDAGGGEVPQTRVIRSRRGGVKPMTLEEAALELDGRGEGVLVYRDAASDRVTVLFRRRDGNLGLIEPEA
jgi:putative sigma-54 modulation protein